MPTELVLAGDFNSIIQHTDTTGTVSYSKALEKLIKDLELHDVWDHTIKNRGYTHYAPKSASRLDRIYTSKILYSKKKGVQTIATAFTDHLSVVLHLGTDTPMDTRGKGYWKMNNSILSDPTFHSTLNNRWKSWQRDKCLYPNTRTWWTKCVKGRLKKTFICESAARNRERTTLENFYYESIYDAIGSNIEPNKLHTTLNNLKAKTVRLRRLPIQRLFLGAPEQDTYR
jgi:hypothetical protein